MIRNLASMRSFQTQVRLFSSGTSKLLAYGLDYLLDKPPHQIINMPALSPTMTQGNIGAWKKKEGDTIHPGDVLVEIETDKATMDFEYQEEGVLAKILATEGTKDFAVGRPLAVMVEEKKDIAAFKDFRVESEVKQVTTTETTEEPKIKSEAGAKASYGSSQTIVTASSLISEPPWIIASPVARYIAKDHNIDLSQLKGSGPNNRILKHDVLEVVKGTAPSKPSTVSHGKQFVDIPLTNMRKIIAERLSDSKQTIPHYYLTSEINMTRTLGIRKHINEDAKGKLKVSVNDIIIKAAAMSMRNVPEVNSAWHGDFIRQHSNVDISVAVATDSGLITPIVKDANVKGLEQISSEVRQLADLAKKNKLRPEQFQGGTFTISNLGMFGSISTFTAIINPPQSCILAVGGVTKKLTLSSDNSIVESEMMHVTLSCDHRIVDGATGAKWLAWLKKYLEEPSLMLL